MSTPIYYVLFESILKRMFEKLDYDVKVNSDIRTDGSSQANDYDFLLTKDGKKMVADAKFYRSRQVNGSLIADSSINLARLARRHNADQGILIVNNVVPVKLVKMIYERYAIEVWNRGVLFTQLEQASLELREEFEQLLLSVQQGIDILPVGSKEHINLSYFKETPTPHVAETTIPTDSGAQLCEQLKNIECGNDHWRHYEEKCTEILKFVFDKDLALWERQTSTDDELSRFDLICRIASKDDFWRSLVAAFNSRFVLFEFKNYCNPISQNQIQTTEKYLYIKALRSVANIIARHGASENAKKAARGALKEHGKLIIILSDNDLCEMAKIKDHNNSPNDYLADVIDNWLISLSR